MAGGVNPSNVQAVQPSTSGQPSVFNQAAGAYNAALQGPNIGQFMNPFTSAVTARTMDDMNRARMMTMNQNGAQATQAGAYGGSRHGIADAETNRAFFDQAGNMAANLNMQGFNTALGAAQQQQGMMSQLAGQGFNFGQTLNGNLSAAGNQKQALMQQLIDAAKGQYAGFTGAPQAGLNSVMQATGMGNMGQNTQTTSSKPGLLNIIGAGLGLFA